MPALSSPFDEMPAQSSPGAAATIPSAGCRFPGAGGNAGSWPRGTRARLHYKVCDDGRYALLDTSEAEIAAIDGHVPNIMCPGGSGCGDYVIMTIDDTGEISDWHIDLSEFESCEP